MHAVECHLKAEEKKNKIQFSDANKLFYEYQMIKQFSVFGSIPTNQITATYFVYDVSFK